MKYILLLLSIFFASLGQTQVWRGYEVDELVNGTGIIKKIGAPLIGYSFDTTDVSRKDRITATIDYRDYKKDGYYVQYFNYPTDTASVEYFVGDIGVGNVYYKYPSGQLKQTGVYENGVLRITEMWNENGERYLKNVKINSAGLFTNDSAEILHGRYPVFAGCGRAGEGYVYFINGIVDSTVHTVPSIHGRFQESRINYRTNLLTMTFFDENNNVTHINQLGIDSGEPIEFSHYNEIAYSCDKSKFSKVIYTRTFYPQSSIIKEEGYYENGQKTGNWIYYDEHGEILRQEHY